MLGNIAVEAMVRFLKGTCAVCRNEGISVFFYEKGKQVRASGEYIAVNHLPFVHRGEGVGEGVVNVNVHVPKIMNDLPPAKRLHKIVSEITNLFIPHGLYLGNAYFEYYADSRPTPDNDGTYFVNLQFRVIFNDLNY